MTDSITTTKVYKDAAEAVNEFIWTIRESGTEKVTIVAEAGEYTVTTTRRSNEREK